MDSAVERTRPDIANEGSRRGAARRGALIALVALALAAVGTLWSLAGRGERDAAAAGLTAPAGGRGGASTAFENPLAGGRVGALPVPESLADEVGELDAWLLEGGGPSAPGRGASKARETRRFESQPGSKYAWRTADYVGGGFFDLAFRTELEGAVIEEHYPTGEIWYRGRQIQRDGEWLRDGPWKAWFPSGQVHEDGAYRLGSEEGLWTWFWPDGTTMARGRYLEGQREGTWVYYHENGQVLMEGDYVRGLASGRWTHYHASGARRTEGLMREGEPTGDWVVWDEGGERVIESD